MQITVRDVAKLLKVSEKTVYRWITQGDLPVYRINDQYRFNRAEILQWATAKKLNATDEIFKEPVSDEPLPGLNDALQAGGIFYRVEGTDRDSVLKAIVESLRLPEEVDRKFLTRVLLAREDLCSTAVGRGVAIPHPRSPVVMHLPRPMVTLCFLEQPIDFGALDGQPVQVMFTVLSPTLRGHLHLLAHLAAALGVDGFREAITRQATREEIYAEARKVEESLTARPAVARK
ncbi:MAG: PTS sugar transporter subunit IIA [Planctomycetota bacterium]|nr:PTS sugar transporter subunit IIA [Planctomycetota bacterium]